MGIKQILKNITYCLVASTVYAQYSKVPRSCQDIESYFSKLNIEYENVLGDCANDDFGVINRLNIYSMDDAVVEAISNMPTIEELYFTDRKTKNINLAPLNKLNELRSLEIRNPVTKYYHPRSTLSFNSFNGLKSLNKLIINGYDLSQENIDEIATLSNLSELIFENCDYHKELINFDSLKNLINLESLSFVNFFPESTPLNEIPGFIYSMTNLKKLVISDNHVTTIPQEILQLKNIEYLDLRSNDIEEIPEFLNFLENLSFINFIFNPNLKGKTLTNERLTTCLYDNESSVCKSKEMSCFRSDLTLPLCNDTSFTKRNYYKLDY